MVDVFGSRWLFHSGHPSWACLCLLLLSFSPTTGKKEQVMQSVLIWSSLAPACPYFSLSLGRKDYFPLYPPTLNCQLLPPWLPGLYLLSKTPASSSPLWKQVLRLLLKELQGSCVTVFEWEWVRAVRKGAWWLQVELPVCLVLSCSHDIEEGRCFFSFHWDE